MAEKKQDAEILEEFENTGEDNKDEIELEEVELSETNKLKQIKTKLKECEKEKSKYLDDLQRAKADFLNTKKRLESQAAETNERNLDEFISSLLPLCDSFDMALKDTEAWEAVDDNWRKGVEGIKAQLDAILKQHQVKEITALNEKFDPNFHEAMSTKSGEGDSDIVVEILQKGYERNGKVIRPAKVIIQN